MPQLRPASDSFWDHRCRSIHLVQNHSAALQRSASRADYEPRGSFWAKPLRHLLRFQGCTALAQVNKREELEIREGPRIEEKRRNSCLVIIYLLKVLGLQCLYLICILALQVFAAWDLKPIYSKPLWKILAFLSFLCTVFSLTTVIFLEVIAGYA